MIVLGLGSNLENRLQHLRKAFRLLSTLPGLEIKQVSPVYMSDALLPPDAPLSWNTPYLNLAIRCETVLSPHALLEKTKLIERQVGRTPEKHWGPRIIDIDLLAWDNLVLYDDKLHIPHENLHERPFALWPLADVAPDWIYPLPGPLNGKSASEIATQWGSRFSNDAPFHTVQIAHRIDQAALMGIINVTPDSFSDGGKFIDPDFTCAEIEKMVNAGAEIIDIGAESTRPYATPLDHEMEWQRLLPVLDKLNNKINKFNIRPIISVDTRHSVIAQKALAMGADWINDVSALHEPEMYAIVQNSNCDIVIMHHMGIPANPNNVVKEKDVVRAVYEWGSHKISELEKNKIERSRIIFDIGIGFGKTAQQSLILLQQIERFKSLDVRLCVGHSRKSFFSLFSNHAFKDRDLETVIFSLKLAKHVEYLRVHDIDLHARAFKASSFLHDATIWKDPNITIRSPNVEELNAD